VRRGDVETESLLEATLPPLPEYVGDSNTWRPLRPLLWPVKDDRARCCLPRITPNGTARVHTLGDVNGLSRDAIEALPAAIYMTDAEGRLTFYNEAAAELWGCRPELGESKFCGSSLNYLAEPLCSGSKSLSLTSAMALEMGLNSNVST
jgi:PAS domain-containing protein